MNIKRRIITEFQIARAEIPPLSEVSTASPLHFEVAKLRLIILEFLHSALSYLLKKSVISVVVARMYLAVKDFGLFFLDTSGRRD
jgi:hypothetical protein